MTAAGAAPHVDKGEAIRARRARQSVTSYRADRKTITDETTAAMADSAEVRMHQIAL